MFELGFVDLRGRLRSKSFTAPCPEATFSETVLLHRQDGTAVATARWGGRHHPSVLARADATYEFAGGDFAMARLLDADGSSHPLCVRTLLAGVQAELAVQAPGVTVGYELEFWCDDEDAGAGGFDLYGARLSGGTGFDLLDAVAAVGPAMAETLGTVCREYEVGQYEVATRPRPPVESADTAVLLREALRATAASRGARISFAALPRPTSSGNALQVNVVVPGLSEGTEPSSGLLGCAAVVARTVVDHCLAFCPTESSYERLATHDFTSIREWAVNRRDCVVRLVPAGASWRLEVRLADPGANVHLITFLVLDAVSRFLRAPKNGSADVAVADLPRTLAAASARWQSAEGGLPRDVRDALTAVLASADDGKVDA